MDNKTRAEKIVRQWSPSVQTLDDLKKLITSQLDEAVREDREQFRHCMHCRIQAIEETKKKAAGIAERPWDYCPTEDGKYAPLYQTATEIAERIRGMTNESSK